MFKIILSFINGDTINYDIDLSLNIKSIIENIEKFNKIYKYDTNSFKFIINNEYNI